MPTKELGKLLSKAGVLELLEARRYLETAVAELAAKRRNEKDLLHLEELVQEMEQAEKEHDHVIHSEKDKQFHLLISKMSNNSFLELMMTAIQESLATQQMEIFSIREDEQIKIAKESQYYHKKILATIQDKDSEQAKRNIYLHLRSIEQFIEKTL